MQLTDDQIAKLSSLGLNQPPKPSIVPLLSISSLSILSLTGLILLKSKQNQNVESQFTDHNSQITSPSPTQTPKSIQHYLLASQTYFSQALAIQQSNTPANKQTDRLTDLINQSLLSATEATKLFPQDSRGYEQRARIYQSLSDSQPQFIDAALADYSIASKLNPSSAEITRSLASLFAKKGDPQSTLRYLVTTVSLEPTKAQNFYDLARIQQQIGQIPEALATYTRLLPLLTDQTQISQVSLEKSALEHLLSQSDHRSQITGHESQNITSPVPSTKLQAPNSEGPLLETSLSNNPIIASPETEKSISVTNQSNSNALSGNHTLPANQKQVTLQNSQVSSISQIYLTTTQGGKNQNLQVLSKSTGSFIVGLDSPIPEDIEFKYWIIN